MKIKYILASLHGSILCSQLSGYANVYSSLEQAKENIRLTGRILFIGEVLYEHNKITVRRWLGGDGKWYKNIEDSPNRSFYNVNLIKEDEKA